MIGAFFENCEASNSYLKKLNERHIGPEKLGWPIRANLNSIVQNHFS